MAEVYPYVEATDWTCPGCGSLCSPDEGVCMLCGAEEVIQFFDLADWGDRHRVTVQGTQGGIVCHCETCNETYCCDSPSEAEAWKSKHG